MKSGKLLEKAGASVEYAEQYFTQYKDLLILELTERLAVSGSMLITRTIIFMMVLMSLLLVSIGIGLYLTEVWGSALAGFGCASAGLLLLTGLIYLLKKPLITDPIIAGIIKSAYDEED